MRRMNRANPGLSSGADIYQDFVIIELTSSLRLLSFCQTRFVMLAHPDRCLTAITVTKCHKVRDYSELSYFWSDRLCAPVLEKPRTAGAAGGRAGARARKIFEIWPPRPPAPARNFKSGAQEMLRVFQHWCALWDSFKAK